MAAVTVARLEAVLGADTDQFDRAMNKSHGTIGKLGKAAALGGLAIGAGLAVGLKKSVDAALESEKAEVRLTAAMDQAHISAKQRAAANEAISATSRRAALDDEDLSDVFAKLVRTTGDATKAQEGMNLAADIARARNISLEAAAKGVERAYNGSAAGLGKFGVLVVKTSENMDAAKGTIDSWRDANGKLDESEKIKAKQLLESAKALDKSATATDTLDRATKQFTGSSEAYGKTAAGAQERFQVAVENLQESIGKKLLPVLAKLAEVALQVLEWMEVNWPKLMKIIGPVMDDIKAKIEEITADIQRIWEAHGKQIMAVVTFVFGTIKTAIENTMKIIQGIVNVAMGILTGDWQRAWDGIKGIVDGVFGAIKLLMSTWLTILKAAALAIGTAIKNAVVDGLEGIGNAAWNVVNNIGEIITDSAGAILGWGTSVATNIVKGVVDGLFGIGNKAWDVINNIGSVIEDVVKQINGWGHDVARFLINGLLDGLEGLGSKILDKIKDAFNFVKSHLPSLPGIPNPFGDPADPSFVPTTGYAGGIDLMGASPVMMPFAAMGQALGLRVTSGLRPGAVTANGTPSDHGFGKALDMADGPSAMAAFFKALIGNPAVKQAFYDPLGSIFGGKWNSYREGGHSDHVHVATYDQGGLLRPGWTMAYNGTGRNEYVSKGGGDMYFNFPQFVGSKQDVMAWMREAAALFQRQNGRPAFGS